jgi:hypothetical protein
VQNRGAGGRRCRNQQCEANRYLAAETLRKLRDQIFAVVYMTRAHVPVMIQENIYDPKQQCNDCHIMPKGGVYVCIAMSPINIKHGFVVDTRGDIDILLDSSLPHAVEYTVEAMSWVKIWQRVYRMGVKGKKNKSKKKKKKKSSIVKIEVVNVKIEELK